MVTIIHTYIHLFNVNLLVAACVSTELKDCIGPHFVCPNCVKHSRSYAGLLPSRRITMLMTTEHDWQSVTHTHTDRHTQTDRQTHRHTHRHTHRQTDTQTDTDTDWHRHTHRQTDRQTHRQTDVSVLDSPLLLSLSSTADSFVMWTDRQTHTHTDTHTDRQTDVSVLVSLLLSSLSATADSFVMWTNNVYNKQIMYHKPDGVENHSSQLTQ